MLSDVSGQGSVYAKRKSMQDRKNVSQLFSNALAIRFPGVNPTGFLNSTYPFLAWILHPVVVCINIVFLVSALFLVLSNLNEIYAGKPSASAFFAIENLPFLALSIFVTKTIHELGHAYACKHFGAECHTMGFMLLVMSPAVYFDTRDSWMLPSKKKRILIAAAGMFFELTLAAVAAYVWFYSQPGRLHVFCLNLIVVSSISTVLFNANPLVRHDGYCILSDLFEIPNFAQRSMTSLKSWLRQTTLGLPVIKGQLMPIWQRVSFVCYAIATAFYGWFILVVIYWALINFFATQQLSFVGYALVAASIAWLLGKLAWQLVKFFRVPGRSKQIKILRLILTTAVMGTIVWLFLYLPVNRNVTSSVIVQPSGATTVFVKSPGTLARVNVIPGEQVKENAVLFKLQNTEFEKEIGELDIRIARLESEIELLRSQKLDSTSAVFLTSKATELHRLGFQRAERAEQIERLTILAPQDGIVLPVTFMGAEESNRHENIFEQNSLGAFLDTATAICSVGNSNGHVAIAFVDQASVELLGIGQNVEILLDEFVDIPLSGKITSISNDKLELIPGGQTRRFGREIGSNEITDSVEPFAHLFKVEISIELNDLRLIPGMHGQAKVLLERTTVFNQGYRYILRVFSSRFLIPKF